MLFRVHYYPRLLILFKPLKLLHRLSSTVFFKDVPYLWFRVELLVRNIAIHYISFELWVVPIVFLNETRVCCDIWCVLIPLAICPPFHVAVHKRTVSSFWWRCTVLSITCRWLYFLYTPVLSISALLILLSIVRIWLLHLHLDFLHR